MPNYTTEDIKDVKDDESPFYTEDSTKRPDPNSMINMSKIPQGAGLDADTIQGIIAVTASVAGPNKLVATGSDGKLPASVIP